MSQSDPKGPSPPSWPDIDGHTLEMGPDPSDAEWAAQHLNGDDPTPNEVLDRLAEEAEAQSRYENGNLPI